MLDYRRSLIAMHHRFAEDRACAEYLVDVRNYSTDSLHDFWKLSSPP